MTTPVHDPAQYVSFLLAGEPYAVPILRVREIVEYDVLTRVPMAPASVRGVLNLRGSVIPVIDLGKKLGLPPAAPTRWTCIVIVEVALDTEQAVMGLLIDEVGEVLELGSGDIDPAPSFGTGVRLDYLDGVGKVGKKMVLLLDIDRILCPEELASAAPNGAGVESSSPAGEGPGEV